MFIWGFKSKKIVVNNISDIECGACNGKSVNTVGLVRYLHLFWIPLFVFYIKLSIFCAGCGNNITKKDLPIDFYKQLRHRVFSPKAMLPMNFGIILISTILVIFLMFAFIRRYV